MLASRGSRHNENYLIQIFNGRNNIHCALPGINIVLTSAPCVAGILATFHPGLSLAECPVLATPAPPTIITRDKETDPASPAYVTASSGASLGSLLLVLASFCLLRAV